MKWALVMPANGSSAFGFDAFDALAEILDSQERESRPRSESRQRFATERGSRRLHGIT